MEEILASIRRIISEDAAPPAAQPVPAARPMSVTPSPSVYAGAMAGFVANPQVRQPVAPPVMTPEPMAGDDDDILDLGANYAAVTRAPLAANGHFAPALTPVPSPPEMPAETPLAVKIDPVPQVWSPQIGQAAEVPVPEIAAPMVAALAEASSDSRRPPEPFVAEPAAPQAEIASPEPIPVEPPAVELKLEEIPLAAMTPELPALQEAAAVDLPPEPVVPAEPDVQAEPVVPAAPELPPAGIEAIMPVAALPVAPMAATTVETAFAAAATGNGAPARTLEDAVADMLKPMLRDWLDTNMPRIIERVMAKDSR